MKIEKLSECSVKISLSEKDFSQYGIRYDSWNSDITAEFLLSISDKIKFKTGADITSEKLYVEIFSKSSGCLIYISFPPKRTHKERKRRMACIFSDYDSLKRFCRRMKNEFPDIISSSSLFCSTCVLRLEIEIPCTCVDLISDSAENGYITECDDISDAAVLEYYSCVEPYNAAEKIASV